MENKYNHDSVQELLLWAQKTLENKAYPKGNVQLNKSTKILDCGSFLSTMMQMISKNWENPTFNTAIDQLREFRNIMEKAAE